MHHLYFAKNGDQNERVKSENIWRGREMESSFSRKLSHRNN